MELLRKHLPKDRFKQTELFCKHWLNSSYFAGWYMKGDRTVWAYRFSYPANSPAGFVSEGQAKRFDVISKQAVP